MNSAAAPLFSLRERVTIVTGGAGLIGRAVAVALRDSGATVYAGEPDGSCPAEGIRGLALDIASEGSVNAAIERVLGETGRLDAMVNCAYPRSEDWGAACADVTQASWNANVDMHLGGYFLTSRAAAEAMKTRGGGSIVNLGSIYGVAGPDFSLYEGLEMGNAVAYAAIKGGVIAMTRYLATYYGHAGVRANVVSPGGMLADQPAEFIERYEAKTPLGRMGTPDDVVGAVVFLVSDAGAYVTGQNLVVDGGWTAW